MFYTFFTTITSFSTFLNLNLRISQINYDLEFYLSYKRRQESEAGQNM